jgi:hypothetical protein
LAAFSINVDATIVNMALPTLVRELHADDQPAPVDRRRVDVTGDDEEAETRPRTSANFTLLPAAPTESPPRAAPRPCLGGGISK